MQGQAGGPRHEELAENYTRSWSDSSLRVNLLAPRNGVLIQAGKELAGAWEGCWQHGKARTQPPACPAESWAVVWGVKLRWRTECCRARTAALCVPNEGKERGFIPQLCV